MMNEIVISERDYKILNEILKKFTSIQELSKSLNIPITTLHSWVEEMKSRGYIEVLEETYNRITLTEEGRLYSEIGLPEKRLALFLEKEGPKTLEELKSRFDAKELDIAIMHGIKKKMIEYDKGKLRFVLLKEFEEELLKEIREKKELLVKDLDDRIKRLKKRGLIEVSPFKITYVRASPLIINAFESKKYRVLSEVSKITSEMISSGKWKESFLKPYNLEALPPLRYFGRSHVYMRFLDEVKSILLEMGFEEYEDEYVIPELWNFDVLFVPQDHPARDVQDTFRPIIPLADLDEELAESVKKMHEDTFRSSLGWEYKWDVNMARRYVLRTHTTPVSIKYIYLNKDKEAKVFCISRNFRRDIPDKTHFIEFYQCEGIMVGKNLNFSNLLYFLKDFTSRLGLERIKFNPSYFPFTEPSVEGAVLHPKLGWIEALPGGMFRPEILKALKVNAKVLAWGIGIDRLAMAALGIEDIRELFSKDINFLRTAVLF